MKEENIIRRGESPLSNAAGMLSKMRAENQPSDSGMQRSLVTLTGALTIEW